VGLAVAIPAVLFYNYFVHRVDRVEDEMSEYKNLMFLPFEKGHSQAFCTATNRSANKSADGALIAMKSNRRRKAIADLNITNLVDVVFTLLIIFMITAPMMTQGVQVDLPKADRRERGVSMTFIRFPSTGRNEIFIDQERIQPR